MRGILRLQFWLALSFLTCSWCSEVWAHDEPLVVVKGGKYGFIDHSGKVVIAPQFLWADDFWRGLGTIYVCGRYLSIDPSGQVHPLRIAVAGQLEPSNMGKHTGFVDGSGKFQIPPTFDNALPFSEGLAAVQVGEKFGFIDASGRLVIQPLFKAAFYFQEGVASVETESGPTIIDRKGKVIAEGFEVKDVVAQERIPVAKDGKAGYLDLTGRLLIPLLYDKVRGFSEGMAAIEKDGKWGFINRDGKLIIPLLFDQTAPFSNGLAPAKIGTRSGFIEKTGKFAFLLDFEYAPGFLTGDTEYNRLTAPSDVSRFWTADGKFGYVNLKGKVIWGPTPEAPDHGPITGWSRAEQEQSCDGIPDNKRRQIERLTDK